MAAYRFADPFTLTLLPSRPRTHQLEDASRTALREAVPPEWIVRDLPSDYGLDAEIEIVARDGAVTGRRFNVQLKATDDAAVAAVRLSTDTARYYRGLDLPVLLVLYRAASHQLRAQWFHALDRDYGEGQAEASFRLDDNTVWTEETPAVLDAGLASFRFFRSPGLPLPLRLSMETPDHAIFGEPSAEVLRAARAAAAEAPGLIAYGDPVHGGRVVIRESETSVFLGDTASFTWPTATAGSDMASFPYDVLVGAALALAQVGQLDLAARLAHRFAGRSALVADGQVLFSIADILVRAHRPTEALDILDEIEDNHPERAGMVLHLIIAALRLSSLQSPHEIERYHTYLRRQIERAQASGEPQRLAIAHYNFANQLRSRRQRKEAIRHYRLAVRAWPRYGELEYWNRELAGVLYHVGRYQLSAYHYSRAVEIGTDAPVKGVLGDALMFAGRYREALARFIEATEDEREGQVEWGLKRWLLESLQEWGLEDQVRQTRAAERRAEEIRDTLHGVDARDALREALHLDWLSGLVWFNLGVVEERELGNHQAALFAFIASGLCQSGDVEAWGNAIIVAANLGLAGADADLIEAVGQFAYFANGDSLLDQVSRVAREQSGDFPVADFVNGVERAILATQPRQAVEPLESADPALSAAHVRLDPNA